MRVDVVRDNHQLAKTGLIEVLREQLGVPAPEIGRVRLLHRRGSANQVPHHPPRVVDRGPGGKRRAGRQPPPAAGAPIGRTAPSLDQHGDRRRREHQHDEARNPGGECLGREGRFRCMQVRGDETAGAARAHQLQQEIDGKDRQTECHQRQRRRGNRNGGGDAPDGEARSLAPGIQRLNPWGSPKAFRVPQPLGSVDRGKQGAHRADPAAADDVELHAGFVQCAQDAGMVGAGGAAAAEHQRRPQARGVRAVNAVRRSQRRSRHQVASSWMVMSLTISNSRTPPGVVTLTLSPSSLFRNARPIGEVVEMRPFAASASSGITS